MSLFLYLPCLQAQNSSTKTRNFMKLWHNVIKMMMILLYMYYVSVALSPLCLNFLLFYSTDIDHDLSVCQPTTWSRFNYLSNNVMDCGDIL